MSKYSKKVLYDYILGNDIYGYDIDELENDYIFIKEVVDISGDKKMYDLCDDKLKGNFELMKFLVLKFKDDEQFIKKVAQDFLKLSNDEDDIFEINIIVSNLVGKEYSSLLENINYIDAKCKYNELRTKYILESRNDSEEVKDYYQMSFDYFADVYAGREIIIDYIAKNMVDEIFSEEDYSLEELIHTKFKTKEDLEQFGTINFILSYVSLYDSHLSDYLKTNIKLIDTLKDSINNIKNNFNSYNERKRNEIMNWIIDYLYKYSLENGHFSGIELIRHITKDLNIKDPIIKKEISDYCDDLEEFSYPMMQTDIEDTDLKSNIEYTKLKMKVKEVLKKYEVPDEYFEENESNHKCKVLRFTTEDKK